MSESDQDEVFYNWKGTVLQVVKKDPNLGPYAWNAKQLINFDTKEVVWDCVSDNREEFTRIISSASTLQPEEAVRRTSMISGTVRMSPISTDRTWNARAESDGTLVRDGEIGDLVAWVVEHEGKVVMTLNANSSLTYLYSSSLPVEAWLVDMKTYQKVVSNKCSFSPPATARKVLTPISQLKIAEKEGRRIDRAIEYLPPGHAGERGDQPFSRLFFSPTAAAAAGGGGGVLQQERQQHTPASSLLAGSSGGLNTGGFVGGGGARLVSSGGGGSRGGATPGSAGVFTPGSSDWQDVVECTPAHGQASRRAGLAPAAPISGAALPPRAIPFVVINTAGSFEVSSEAKDVLEAIQGPVGVVSCAGMYRTGKSYLLNKVILDDPHSGFKVGSTVNACTKGLWLWSEPMAGATAADGTPITLLVVDTEGMGALDAHAEHDTKIFTLALLLSSMFIYNSVGAIDEGAINNLSLVANLTKHIKVKAGARSETGEAFGEVFPSFLWVVRDFALQLVGSDGESITATEYLERSLKPAPGQSNQVEEKNRVRRMLQAFFPGRDCITMKRPVEDESLLQQLDSLPASKLRPEFARQAQMLKNRVLHGCPPKKVGGGAVDGSMLVGLASAYADAINSGAVPTIDNAWVQVCRSRNTRALYDAADSAGSLAQEIEANNLPMGDAELAASLEGLRATALAVFERGAIGEEAGEARGELEARVAAMGQRLTRENEREGRARCAAIIEELYAPIASKVSSTDYVLLSEYEAEVAHVRQEYSSRAPRSGYSDGVADRYLEARGKEFVRSMLGAAAKRAEKSEREAEEERRRVEREVERVRAEGGARIVLLETKLEQAEKEVMRAQEAEESEREGRAELARLREEERREWADRSRALEDKVRRSEVLSSDAEARMGDSARDWAREKARLNAEVEEIRAARDEGEREKAGLREALRRAAGSLEGREEELAAAVKQRNALDAAVAEMRRERDELQATVEAARGEGGEMAARLEREKAEVRRLAGLVQEAESRSEAAEEREREMARERERERLLLRQEIDFSRARAGELEGREGEFRKQVDAVRRQCEEDNELFKQTLEAQVAKLKTRLAESEERAKVVEEEAAEAREAASVEWKRVMEESKRSQALFRERDAELTSKSEEWEARVKKARDEGDAQCDVLREQVVSLEATLARVRRDGGEADVLREQLERVEGEARVLRSSSRELERGLERQRADVADLEERLKIANERISEEHAAAVAEREAARKASEGGGRGEAALKARVAELEATVECEREARKTERVSEAGRREHLQRENARMERELHDLKEEHELVDREARVLRCASGDATVVKMRLEENEGRHRRAIRDLTEAHESAVVVLREGHAAEKLALEERVAYLEATLGDKEQDCQELEEALAELEEEKKQEMARFANEQHLVRLELESKLLIQEQLAVMYAQESTKDSSPTRKGTPSKSMRTPVVDETSDLYAAATGASAEVRKQMTVIQKDTEERLNARTKRVKELEAALSLSKRECRLYQKQIAQLHTANQMTNEMASVRLAGAESSGGNAGAAARVSELEGVNARLRDLLDRMELDLLRERGRRADRDVALSGLVSEGVDVFGRAGLHWLSPWPQWLKVLSLPGYQSLLPKMGVTVGGLVNGVMLYSIDISHGCDRRGSWAVIKRFSHVCALHNALCKEVASYAKAPPMLAKALLAERGRMFTGSSEARADRRRGLIASYLSFLSLCVEALASSSFAGFLDMREDMLDSDALAGGAGGRLLTAQDGAQKLLNSLPGVDGRSLRLAETEESPSKLLAAMRLREVKSAAAEAEKEAARANLDSSRLSDTTAEALASEEASERAAAIHQEGGDGGEASDEGVGEGGGEGGQAGAGGAWGASIMEETEQSTDTTQTHVSPSVSPGEMLGEPEPRNLTLEFAACPDKASGRFPGLGSPAADSGEGNGTKSVWFRDDNVSEEGGWGAGGKPVLAGVSPGGMPKELFGGVVEEGGEGGWSVRDI